MTEFKKGDRVRIVGEFEVEGVHFDPDDPHLYGTVYVQGLGGHKSLSGFVPVEHLTKIEPPKPDWRAFVEALGSGTPHRAHYVDGAVGRVRAVGQPDGLGIPWSLVDHIEVAKWGDE